jgi:uncharacterized membrane protein
MLRNSIIIRDIIGIIAITAIVILGGFGIWKFQQAQYPNFTLPSMELAPGLIFTLMFMIIFLVCVLFIQLYYRWWERKNIRGDDYPSNPRVNKITGLPE